MTDQVCHLFDNDDLATEPTFRELVVAEMRNQHRTRQDFARSVASRAECNPETILRFIRGTHDTTVNVLQHMLAEMSEFRDKKAREIVLDTKQPGR